jgi:hypothetical protein
LSLCGSAADGTSPEPERSICGPMWKSHNLRNEAEGLTYVSQLEHLKVLLRGAFHATRESSHRR